jgi:DNA (cytosine-5)-methyltransferase 1
VSRRSHQVLSLFSGSGGLDVGLEAARFRVALCVEIDEDCLQTMSLNRPRWKLAVPGDIHSLSPQEIMRQASLRPYELSLLAGGPPCQPFSKSGYWAKGDSMRLEDPRATTLDAYLAMVGVALPEVVLLENVKGIAFSKKDEALAMIFDGFESINKNHGTAYKPIIVHLNAADYGVPQNRERVFIVAHREGKKFVLPSATHTSVPVDECGDGLEPHRTCWDAIGDLDFDTWPTELNSRGKWAGLLPSIPEGENYLWHTERAGGEALFGWRTRYWSFLLKLAKDRPSWTIQAQPGPATGPFHWKSRQLSTRELARLQTFPDDYGFFGGPRSTYRQIGNAVPPAIGELFGLEIRRQFFGERVRRRVTLIPPARNDLPLPEVVGNVPNNYLELRGEHVAHPGTGKGPSAIQRGTQRTENDGQQKESSSSSNVERPSA